MSRSAGVSAENNFVKGMVTEFSGLNFPENSCSDAINCFFTKEGRIQRRKGINFEEGFTLIPYTLADDYKINSIYWQNVAGDSLRAMVVVQAGSDLLFFDLKGNDPLSQHYEASYTVSLNTHRISGSPVTSKEFAQFASGNGRLYVAHPYCQPFYIKHDPITNTMVSVALDIRIRDFLILDDGEPEADEEIKDRNVQAEYNLKNQGWRDKYLEAWDKDNKGHKDVWPAKSMLWWYFRLPAGDDTDTQLKGLDFKAGRRNRFSTAGNSFAPRGYFILDAFYQDRDAKINKPGVYPVVSAGYQRPGAVAFMNGRIFYGGTNADKFSNVIYFSNVLRDLDQPIRFYQNGDPTSEVSYELLPNDGGNIVIPEAGRIVWMHQIADMLVVVATNGIWAIAGSEGVGFGANDYSVNKISDYGALSHTSIVLAEGTPVWWNSEGIWTYTKDQGVISLSRTTIQSFYNDIPLACKLASKGSYNPISQEMVWVYSSNYSTPNLYNRMLVFNSATGAFYPYAISNGAYVRDIVSISGLSVSTVQATVTNNAGATVTDSGGAVVTASETSAVNLETTLKFFTESGNNITFSELNNGDYVDWAATGSAAAYDSYFVTAFKLKGEANRKFQSPYITVHTEAVENGSCFLSAIWDFANDGRSGRITNTQQIYGPNQYRTYAYRRLKLRGNGMVLQMKFQSDGNNPFNIIGWATYDTVNDRV